MASVVIQLYLWGIDMSLTKKEKLWLEGLQDYLITAPASLKRKVSSGNLSAYTTGDFDITLFNNKMVEDYELNSNQIAIDTPVSVEKAGARIDVLFFPFRVESCAG